MGTTNVTAAVLQSRGFYYRLEHGELGKTLEEIIVIGWERPGGRRLGGLPSRDFHYEGNESKGET